MSLLFLSVSLEALYLGNPAQVMSRGLFSSDKGLWLFQTGYQLDTVFDRKLKCIRCEQSRMDPFQLQITQGVFTAILASRLALYGAVGSMQSYCVLRSFSGQKLWEYRSGDRTTWGGGGRLVVYENRKLSVGFEGACQWAQLPLRGDGSKGKAAWNRPSLHYLEWQWGVGVGGQVSILNPYGAFRYSRVQGKMHPIQGPSFQMRSREPLGLVFGCTITQGNYFDLTIESRFLDEKAISLQATISL